MKSRFDLAAELGKAITLHQNGQLPQAKIVYKKIIRHVPTQAVALHMLGVLYSQAGDFDKAIDLMRKSIKHGPGHPDYLFNLARAYHDRERLDEAIATFLEYLASVPEDVEALHWLGRVWHDKKDWGQAIFYYRLALEKAPGRVDFLNSLGRTHHEQGDFARAAGCYEQALKLQPNDFIVLNNLGETFLKTKRLDEAIACFRQVLSVRPGDAKASNNLGMVLVEEGSLAEAAECFKMAVTSQPGFAEAHYNLGLVLLEQKNYAAAADSFRQALASKSKYPEAHYHLGVVLGKQTRFDEAVSCFRQALSLNPEYAEAHFNLGRALLEKKSYAGAAASFRQALAFKPEDGEVYYNLGFALCEQKKFEEAIDNLQKALSFKPEYSDVYVCLARIYIIQGNFNKALVCCEKGLAANPDHAGCLMLLASLGAGATEKGIIAQQEKSFSEMSADDEEKTTLAFALGKLHADLGDYDKSFFYIAEGNRLKRESYAYSIEEDELLFALIKKVFDESYVKSHAVGGSSDRTPIFILGMPRSGTSLVEQILASHPDVYGAGEIDDISQVVWQLTGGHALPEIFEKIPRSGGDFYSRLATEYLRRLRKHSATAKFITDKHTHNFLFIGAILMALPNARIVHCVREPLDNCLSIYKNLFGDTHKYAFDQQELGQYYLLYLDLMRHWHALFPGKIYDIKYEKMIADQEGETRKLLEHCGLAWDDQCLSFYKTARDVTTLSWTQVRRPIYTDSIQLWQRYRQHLEPLRAILSAA